MLVFRYPLWLCVLTVLVNCVTENLGVWLFVVVRDVCSLANVRMYVLPWRLSTILVQFCSAIYVRVYLSNYHCLYSVYYTLLSLSEVCSVFFVVYEYIYICCTVFLLILRLCLFQSLRFGNLLEKLSCGQANARQQCMELSSTGIM